MLFDFYNSFEGCQTQKLIVSDMYISRELYACKTYRQYINVFTLSVCFMNDFQFFKFSLANQTTIFISIHSFLQGSEGLRWIFVAHHQYTFYTWELFNCVSLDRFKHTFYLIRQMFAKKKESKLILNKISTITLHIEIYLFHQWN